MLFERGFEQAPVVLGFVRVGLGEGEEGAVEAGGVAEVGGDGYGVAGAGVAAGEEFAAEVGVAEKAGGGEGCDVERGLVVVELADEEVAALEGGVTEEGVGGELHGALAVDDAMALMGVAGGAFRKIGRVGGGGFFFDLQKEWVGAGGAGGAFEVDAVVAQADGAGADDLEGDVDGAVLLEEVTALGLEGAGVGGERGEDGFRLFGGDAFEQGWLLTEAAVAVDELRELEEGFLGCGALGGAED